MCWESACLFYSAEGTSVTPPLKLAGDTLSTGGKSSLLLSPQKPRTRRMFIREAQSDGHDDTAATDCHQSSSILTESWGHFADN